MMYRKGVLDKTNVHFYNVDRKTLSTFFVDIKEVI